MRLPVVLLIAAMVSAAGCSRGYWRRNADAEVYAALRGKYADMHYPLDRISIQPDPRSRMFDPFDPDKEPMPPDDPVSHQLMNCVYCMNGYPCWHKWGDTPFVENPDFTEFLPWNDRQQVVLDRDQAVLVGLLNSRTYQRQLENLYLSALDVTFERFRFDVMFFAGNNTFYSAAGPLATGTGLSSSELSTTSFGEARKLFAAGGELVVGLANSIVWQFAGTNTNTNTTLLDFTFVQPLLRGGGRARVLERLTRSERVLLANVRQMERWRRGFYVDIVTGRDPGPGPQRQGGFFGGAGLEGFTGIGGGGFGRAGQGGGQQQAGAGFAGGAGAAQAGGYLGLLQQLQQNRNLAANVAALADSVAQLEAAYDAGRIDRFQVDLARQALYNAQSRLLTAETQYENALDGFKIMLGLPPHLDVVVEDPLLEPFELVDVAIPPLQNTLTRTQQLAGQAIIDLREAAQRPDVDARQLEIQIKRLRELVMRAEQVHQGATAHFAPVAVDIQELRSSVGGRVQSLRRLQARGTDQQPQQGDEDLAAAVGQERVLFGDREAIEAEIQRVEQLPDALEQDLRTVASRFTRLSPELAQLEAELTALGGELANNGNEAWRARLQRTLSSIPDRLVDLSSDLLDLLLVQARAKAESIVLLPIELQGKRAFEIASIKRRDWMNARAALVDSWRLIEFNANELEAVLNVVFSGDISNTGNNPVKLNSATGTLTAGIEFDAPLTRIAERNNYRQALIEYQQARREYYEFVDRVSQALRNILRSIELDQANFELRRAAIRVAIDQVELTQIKLREPPLPGAVGSTFSVTFARDLVSALSDLLNAQNDFLSVWVDYEVQRLSLDYQLGTMELNEYGLWIDPGSAVGTERLDCEMPLFPYQELPEEEIEAVWPSDAPPAEEVPPPGPLDLEPLPGAPVEGVPAANARPLPLRPSVAATASVVAESSPVPLELDAGPALPPEPGPRPVAAVDAAESHDRGDQASSVSETSPAAEASSDGSPREPVWRPRRR